MFLLSKRKLSLRRFIYQSHTKVYMHNIDHEVYLCYNLKIDLVVNYFGGKPMKREEKNQQTQRRIMDSALAEFAEKGHGGSSVNTICAAQGISKGIIYHYFENKDELYLACVEECFQRLTAHLSAALPEEDDGSVEDQLGRYFTGRMTFFQENPVYQPIFCEAVISPPARLFEQIQARRKAFDALTISTLKHLLRQLPLRTDITMEEVVDLFRQFQDFINAQAQASSMPARKCFALRDAQCRRLLTVLLYGVTERGGIDMATKQNSSSILGDINPPKAIIKLALPATLALLAKAVYNIVDTAYIGMLDSDIALTAVGVTVPLLLIMVSIENIFAAGAAVLAGRHLGAKDEEGASRTVTTIIGLSIVIGVVGLGMTKAGALEFLSGSSSETLIVRIASLIAQHGVLAAVLAGLILAGILAATMSTADSQMLAAASSVSQNILQEFGHMKLTEKQSLFAARLTIICVSVVGVVLARDPDSSVFGIVSFAWAGFGGAFGAVVLCALFWKRCNWQGALAGMLCGGLMVFVWKYLISPLGGVFGIYELLPAFLFSLAACVVVSLATPAPGADIEAEFEAAK